MTIICGSHAIPCAVTTGLILAEITIDAHAQTSPQPAEIVPLRAVYNLDFSPSGPPTGLTGGKGRLTLEFTGSRCTEYRLNRRSDVQLQGTAGPVRVQSESSATENPDGTRFTFKLTERKNGAVQRQDSVTAQRGADGQVVATSSRLPGGKATLGRGVNFPMFHERLVMTATTGNAKTFSDTIYNPEIGLSHLEQMNYTFGPAVTAALPKGHPAAPDALKDKRRQRVLMIIKNKADGKQRVREQMTRYDDGSILTASHVVMDGLQIKASLVSLTLLPKGSCS